jgi:dynamin 1-like protein
MDRLIPVVNRLQDVFQRCGVAAPIDLPQVVVVGTQSSGKSSVLEAIIGRDFLPRGAGVVTRRPILIQLIKLPPPPKPDEVDADAVEVQVSALSGSLSTLGSNGSHQKPSRAPTPPTFWVEFLHRPEQKFFDIPAIRREIQAETDRVAGTNKRLVPNALIIKVHASDVVDLTLIDLPGITKVPVGDQPVDIERLVRAMITSYIENKHSIILAVHPANTDLATSDALQMARSVDPHGARTLGVVTKLDLMDSGTNGLDMLNGRVIPLRRGYVGVVNRSQSQLDKSQTIADARIAEKEYFKSSPVYAPCADRMGSAFLASTLSSMLMEHIRDTLPDIRVKMTSHLTDVQAQLKSLGPILAGSDHQAASLLNLLTRYAADFNNALDGRASAATHELTGGARISYIFHDRYGRDLDAMDPFHELAVDDIRTALRNATGHRTPLFIPESAFELLIKRQIARFLPPSLACVELVYDELTRLAEATMESPELARFSRLRESVAEATLKLLKQQKEPTIEMVNHLVDMELSYINTWHPNFVGGKRALTAVVEQHQQHVRQQQLQLQQQQQMQLQNPSYKPTSNGFASAAQVDDNPDAWVEKNLLGQRARAPTKLANSGLADSNKYASTAGRHYTRVGNGLNTSSGNSVSNSIWDQVDGNKDARLSTPGAERRESSNIVTMGRGGPLSVPAHIRVGSDEPVGDSEKQELAIMRMLIESYFDIVRERLQDMVPKAIITFLVNKSKESLQATLVTKLYKPENVNALMKEGSEAAQRRQDLEAVTSMLSEALDVINEVRDVH